MLAQQRRLTDALRGTGSGAIQRQINRFGDILGTHRRFDNSGAVAMARRQAMLQAHDARIRMLMNPLALERIRQQQRRALTLTDSAAWDRVREYQRRAERMVVLMDPASGPAFSSFAASYASDVAARVVAPAATSGAALEPESDQVWLGAASWTQLLWELEFVLKLMELTTAALVVAKVGLAAPAPGALIAVIFMLIVLGEAAAFLAKGRPDD